MATDWDEVDAAWAQSERGGEASGHLPYNTITDRHETGGDEIEFADEGDYWDAIGWRGHENTK